MYLKEIARDSFILLQWNWPASRALEFVEKIELTHFVIRSVVSGIEYYYLFTREEASLLIEKHRNNLSNINVAELFTLHERRSVPVMDAYKSEDTVGSGAVVVEEGSVIGFIYLPQRRMFRGEPLGVPLLRGPSVPRSLEANFPEKVELNAQVSLLVRLTTESPSLNAIPTILPQGTEIDILVQPQSGFELIGRSEGKITITDAKATLPLQFKFRATRLGPGRLIVLAFHDGAALGQITISPIVVPVNQAPNELHHGHSTNSSLTIVQVPQPDLSLLVIEEEINGKPAFSLRLTAIDPNLGWFYKKFGPIELKMDPLQYFHNFFNEIENLEFGTKEERELAERKIEQKGMHLFEELIPDDLKLLLWKNLDRIATMQIISEEPWIPWEILKFYGQDNNGDIQEGPFLCQKVAVTRWFPSIGLKPSLSLKKIALVVPKDSGLAFTNDEKTHMLSLADDNREVIPIEPAKYLKVMDALSSGEYDVWHFSGHGRFPNPVALDGRDPNRAEILLEDNETLTPEDINGIVKRLGKAHPLVFFNACQVGRSAISLTDIGGWAKKFLSADASVFIGSYWSVFDVTAFDFAKAFYGNLLAGLPIGEATKQARNRIKKRGDPTWLAYTVFAHPMARVQL